MKHDQPLLPLGGVHFEVRGARKAEVAGMLEQIKNLDAKPLDELIKVCGASC